MKEKEEKRKKEDGGKEATDDTRYKLYMSHDVVLYVAGDDGV